MKIHHLTVAAALASLKSGLAGLSDADAQWRPLPMIQILAVDLGTARAAGVAGKIWAGLGNSCVSRGVPLA
jgi:hypothetical protein